MEILIYDRKSLLINCRQIPFCFNAIYRNIIENVYVLKLRAVNASVAFAKLRLCAMPFANAGSNGHEVKKGKKGSIESISDENRTGEYELYFEFKIFILHVYD